ncbi:S-adenosylmethionine:tRNA ribosyltransferase-isomerase [Helicobacter canis]|uniref:S-adenosylmethionine:tRNA ribosyltransferase-isomerase n=1 Tax=Helicobacter canis NCTC 12740 TaxID=1357399 RepID=V8CEC0_9HELI|nr:S-adenosylmethionine:tRNA ribosyltransferase-isomerase [Helicobacter canis]ETD25768.1 S-adenosylmethionine:tRNA ribosyltransferase-isomerase [Helicobacter canis NCTC 12740]
MFALSSYDYPLPKHLIATAPIYPREAAKLLVYDRAKEHITHTTFAHLLEFIPKDCIIALNNTRVLKARIYGKKLGTQTSREIFFHRFATRDDFSALASSANTLESTCASLLDSSALALCQIRGRVKLGDIFVCARFYAQVVALLDNGYRAIRFFSLKDSALGEQCGSVAKIMKGTTAKVANLPQFLQSSHSPTAKPAIAVQGVAEAGFFRNPRILEEAKGAERESIATLTPLSQEAVLAMLEEIGHIPLPPYIKRASNDNDIKDYQTLFATQAGAIAAPTASLHLSSTMLEALKEQLVYLTLHIGAGTFASVDVPDIREHTMHTESLHITAQALERLLCAKSRLCVGTSALRSVEFAARLYETHPKPYADLHAQCDIFLHLGNKPRYVDYLLTNFHLPKSTLTMLVASMVGYEQWRKIYEQAIAKEYRFYSYGDAMLIL